MADADVVTQMGNPSVGPGAVPQAKFRVGLLKGQLGDGPNFLQPLAENELKDWEPTD